MENNNIDSKIYEIIEQYIEIIKLLLKEQPTTKTEPLELVTQTNIVEHDFFQDDSGNLSACDSKEEVKFKDFGKPIILFNDLKNSTKLIEELEYKDQLCIYSIYIYYSSKMLSEILDLLGGKLVECTGDGNYSIFLEDSIKENEILNEYKNFLDISMSHEYYSDFEKYILKIDSKEYFLKVGLIRHIFTLLSHDIDQTLEDLFFSIFAIFNIEINKLIKHQLKNHFYTRVGCSTGECKIMRVENNHIRQDKLIGSVVHEAAHKANGK